MKDAFLRNNALTHHHHYYSSSSSSSSEADDDEAASEDDITSLRALVRQRLANNSHHTEYSAVNIVLFCCRKRFSEVLVKHLQRNLRTAGGIIDRVLVYRMGEVDDDPDYPLFITRELDGFVLADAAGEGGEGGGGDDGDAAGCPGLFKCAYLGLQALQERSVVYIKMDDDVVFLAHGALEYLVLDKLRVARAGALVHANGINHIHAPFFHALLGVFEKIEGFGGCSGDDDRDAGAVM
jgi:hypothetical protein